MRTYLQDKVGWTIFQEYSFKKLSSTWTKQKHPPQAINQKRSNKSGSGVAPSITYELPQRISLWDLQSERPKNWPWIWGYMNPNQRRQQNMQQHRKRSNVCWQRPLVRVKNQTRGNQQEMWYKIWMLRQLRKMRMGLSE